MRIPIIGREFELDLIDKLVADKNTQRVMCIEGPGGIGKTRLLQELQHLYRNSPGIKVIGILDFDELSLVAVHNINRRIIEDLNAQSAFDQYIEELQELRLVQQAGWSTSSIERKERKLQNTFVACLSRLASQDRLVFLFDTMERVPREILDYLFEILCSIPNSLTLFAGRRTPYDQLLKVLPDEKSISRRELKWLDQPSSGRYLNEKQRALRVILPQEIQRKLTLLANGSPILLEMAIEWIVRGELLDWSWLAGSNIDELAALPPDERHRKQNEFEAKLVQQIREFRGLGGLDPFILALSIAYPLDVMGVSAVMDISQSEAERLVEFARQQVYIKTLPGGFLSLHDRMRDLVTEHVWHIEDLRGERRQEIHKRMMTYLKARIAEAEHELETSVQQSSEKTADYSSDITSFFHREILERHLHSVLEVQLIQHIAQVDPKAAYDEFLKTYDTALESYRPNDSSILLSRLEEFGFYGRLAPSEQYEIDIRHANFLVFYSSQYDKAGEILGRHVVHLPEAPDQKVDVLRLLGNIQIRKGELHKAIDQFQLALAISKQENLQHKSIEAEAALGWAYRHLCDWNESAEHYTQALRLCYKQRREDELFVSLLNSLALPFGYLQRSEALSLCRQAIDLSERLKSQRTQGTSYSTHGCILYQFGRLNDALDAFEKALDMFEPSRDDELISWACSWKGVTLWSKGCLEEAEAAFKQSLELNFVSHRPMTLNRLGRVYFDRGEYDRAHQIWEESYELSRQIPHPLFEVCGIRDLASVALIKHQYELLDEYRAKLKEYEKKYPVQHALGGARMNVGLLALGKGELEEAENHIAQGLEVFVSFGRYSNQDLDYYLKRLVENVRNINVPQHARTELSKGLREYWLNDKKLFFSHPEAIHFFDELAQ